LLEIAIGHFLAKVVTVVDGSAGPSLLAQSPRLLGSNGVDGEAVRLREQVRSQAPSLRVETFRVLPEAQEGVLDDVGGVFLGTEYAVCEPEDGLAVATVRFGQRRGVAVAHLEDK